MNKKFKTLLTAGLITVIAGTSVVSSDALSKKISIGHKREGAIYLCINGKRYKISLGCNDKPSQGGNSSTEDDNNAGNGNTEDNDDNNIGSGENNGNNDNNIGNDNNQDNSDNNVEEDNDQNDNNDNMGNNNNQDDENKNDNVVDKPNDDKPNNDNNTEDKNETTTDSFLSFQKEVTRLVNVERSKRGLSKLDFNVELSNIATLKSQDMINKNYFSHTSPTYGSPFDMMERFNVSYRSAGENIAKGQRTPQDVVNAWMNSSGHRANILNSNYTDLGVGVAKSSNGTMYWTQMFIGK